MNWEHISYCKTRSGVNEFIYRTLVGARSVGRGTPTSIL